MNSRNQYLKDFRHWDIKNFNTADESAQVRSGKFVYAWRQGRGAESLAGHLQAGVNSAKESKMC